MTASPPEFSRIVRLDEIARLEWPATITADDAERAAIASRFSFASLNQLEAEYSIEREGKDIVATGRVRAALTQPCIATGEPVAETISEEFLIRFIPETEQQSGADDEEIELDAEECDILTYSGNRINIGEAIAETLALAVNPYPRSEVAAVYLREAGVLTEEQAGPFAALAALKGKTGQ